MGFDFGCANLETVTFFLYLPLGRLLLQFRLGHFQLLRSLEENLGLVFPEVGMTV